MAVKRLHKRKREVGGLFLSHKRPVPSIEALFESDIRLGILHEAVVPTGNASDDESPEIPLVGLSYCFRQLLVTMGATGALEIGRWVFLLGLNRNLWFCVPSNTWPVVRGFRLRTADWMYSASHCAAAIIALR